MASLRLTLALVAAMALVPRALSRPCNQSDIRFTFTPCVEGLMSSVGYVVAGCEGPSLVDVPAPRLAPCIKSCPSGTWYNPASVDCDACLPGQMSNSGGKLINDFTVFPEGMTSFCSPAPCAAWSSGPGATYLTSGDNSAPRSNGDESVSSELVTLIRVINPRGGLLQFLYRVESEYQFDGLVLYLNGTAVPGSSEHAPFLLTGVHRDWYQFETKLPVGTTEVRWVYKKDWFQMLDDGQSVGADRAFIRDILIEGVQMFAPTCTPCPAGKYALKSGAMRCTMCPTDSFSVPGSSTCTLCGITEWAPPGSESCRPRLPCTNLDYLAVYSACDPATQKRQQTWRLANSRCIEANPPTSKAVACATCPAGFRDHGDGNCQRCPDGAWTSGVSACAYCDAGKYAYPTTTVDFGALTTTPAGIVFSPLRNRRLFTMRCQGECKACPTANPNCIADNSGFTLTQMSTNDADSTAEVLRTDFSNGAQFKASLFANFTSLDENAYVQFSYFFSRPSYRGTAPIDGDGYVATAIVDGVAQELKAQPNSIDQAAQVIIAVPSVGFHTVELRFAQDATHDSADPVAFVLTEFVLGGDRDGGASSCTTCLGGHYCPAHSSLPIPCPAGTSHWSAGGTSRSVCLPCTGQGYNPSPGASKCLYCGAGTVPTDDRTACLNSCNFTTWTSHARASGTVWGYDNYDLTSLRDTVFGPLYPPGVTPYANSSEADALHVYRFYMSPCSFVNTPPHDDICKWNNGVEVKDSYSCQRISQNQSFGAGSNVAYVLRAPGRLEMTFTGGDICIHGGMGRSTNLTLLCDPTAIATGTPHFVSEEPHCQYNFVLRTVHACPLCTESSFQRVVGKCRPDALREVIYYKADPSDICAGGYTPPPNANITCTRCTRDSYDIAWGQCTNGTRTAFAVLKPAFRECIGNLELRDVLPADMSPEQPCATVEVKIGWNPFTAFFAVLIPFVVIIIAALVVVHIKHRALQHKFQRLSTRDDAPTELHDVPDSFAADGDPEERPAATNGKHHPTSGNGSADPPKVSVGDTKPLHDD